MHTYLQYLQLDCCQRDLPSQSPRWVTIILYAVLLWAIYTHCNGVIVYHVVCLCLGIGAALGQLGWWSGTFFMGEVGPVLFSSPLKTSGTFYFFAGMYSLAILHILLLLPETKVCTNTQFNAVLLRFTGTGTKLGKY